MSDKETIQSVLEKAARRRRCAKAWNGLFRGLFLASALWLAVVAAFKLFPIPFAALGIAGIAAAALTLGGFVFGGRKKDSALETAQWVDRELGSKERLSAAIEFSSSSSWGKVLLRDGARCVEAFQPKRILPYHLPKVARWTVLLLFVGATLGFVPEYRSQRYLDVQKEQAVNRETGRRLESFAKRAIRQGLPTMKPTKEAMLSVEELGKKLQTTKLTRAESLDKIASVAEKLRAETKELDENPAFKRLRQASRALSNDSSQVAELQKKIQALQQKMKSNSGNPDALQEMKNQLEQLQQAAVGQNSNEGGITPEMRQQTVESIANLSQMAREQGISLPDLEEALAAWQSGEIDQFLKALNSAQTDLDKMLEMAKALQKMQMRQAEIGRNLGEQLEKGQAPAARNRLLEMVQKLQSESTDSQEIQRLMAEVSEALEPARGYGEVPSLLQQALRQGKAGNSLESAQSLQAAADELKKLMEQFADMQCLMQSLDALKQAQMCVGNCTGWGQNKPMTPGFQPGGKPGAGVGTWADENGSSYFPETSDRWDNSGIVRPDMESRGHTDRGEGRDAQGMTPTKVRGNFAPGGPMPSITLRGVNIKGESRVSIQEAVAAAQDEAQSALSQQKIPRAYQQTVRSYFDDVAKENVEKSVEE